jgi:hypothetical protein
MPCTTRLDFNRIDGLEVIQHHGLIKCPGIGHGGIQIGVSKQFLDGSYPTAHIQ